MLVHECGDTGRIRKEAKNPKNPKDESDFKFLYDSVRPRMLTHSVTMDIIIRINGIIRVMKVFKRHFIRIHPRIILVSRPIICVMYV